MYFPINLIFGYGEVIKNKIMSSDQKRRSNRHGHSAWTVTEEELHQWILSERDNGVPVSMAKIRLKQIRLTWENNIENFQGGPTWCY